MAKKPRSKVRGAVSRRPKRELRRSIRRAPPAEEVSTFETEAGQKQPLTVVGVGASAGGLEAFSQLLHSLPDDTGLAIVLVQHLAPKHESILPNLLGGATRLPVAQVSDGMHMEADHV